MYTYDLKNARNRQYSLSRRGFKKYLMQKYSISVENEPLELKIDLSKPEFGQNP